MSTKLKSLTSKLERWFDSMPNLPLYLFIFIAVFAVVAFSGRRFIVSQGGQGGTAIDCDKTGINGGGFGASGDMEQIFSDMENMGLKWYQGLMRSHGEGHVQAATDAVNLAANYDINVIVRICDATGACEFDDAGAYISALREISQNTGNKEFWAIAGHNEPNAAEYRDPNIEREFMIQVISGVEDLSNIHLLSPIMDLHFAGATGGYPYDSYFNLLGPEHFSRLYGLAGNMYTDSSVNLPNKLGEFHGWAVDHGLGDKPIFITETGPNPNGGGTFEAFKPQYESIASPDSVVEAALFYRPQGLSPTPVDFLTREQVEEIMDGCEQYGDRDYPDFVTECTYEENPLRACEDIDEEPRRILIPLAYRSDREVWLAQFVQTAQVKIDELRYLAQIDYEGLGEGNEAVVTNEDAPDFESISGFSNRVFPEITVGDEVLDISKAPSLPGYAQFIDENTVIKGRPYFEHGGGILISKLGLSHKWWNSSDDGVPKQLLSNTDQLPDDRNLDIDSQHFSINPPEFDSSVHCAESGVAKIDGLPTDEDSATTGYETVFSTDEGQYEFTLEQMVENSNLNETVGRECIKEEGECKIVTDLSHCNKCREAEAGVKNVTVLNQSGFADIFTIGGFNVSGVDRALVVVASYRDWSDNIQMVTYGSAYLTLGAFGRENEYTTEVWYLPNPPEGTQNVMIYWNDAVEDIVAAAINVNGADISNPIFAAASNHGWSKNADLTLSSPEGGVVIGGLTTYTHNNSVTPIAGSSLWTTQTVNTIGSGVHTDGDGSVTVGWSMTNEPNGWPWSVAAIAINPVQSDEGGWICENIDYTTGQIKEDRRDELTQCINGTQPVQVGVYFDTPDNFQLGGGVKLLKTYLEYLKTFNHDKTICINKNIGAQVDIDEKIYFPTGACNEFSQFIESLPEFSTEQCNADPEFDLPDLPCDINEARVSFDTYLPYLGVPKYVADYLDQTQQAIFKGVQDLPDCSDATDDDVLCYCNEGQIDKMAAYLAQQESISTENEASILGGTTLQALRDYAGGDDDDDDDDYDYGDDDDDIDVYTGSCNEIFDQVKSSPPFTDPEIARHVANVELRMQDLGQGWFCDALTYPYVTCNINTVGKDCENCPVRANALFRHELNHWTFKGSGTLLREFTADATSNNGGWYRFQRAGSSQWLWATQIRDWMIDTQGLPADTFMSYLTGNLTAKRELEQLTGEADFHAFVRGLLQNWDRWSTGDPSPPGLDC